MAKRANFTAKRVAEFSCPAGKQQAIFWDGKVPGLGLRVTAAGAKSYIFEARLYGKTIRMTIGDSRTWSIAQAQSEAIRLKAMVDQGIDPRQVAAEKAAANAARREEDKRRRLLAGEAWQAYIAARRHKWSERHLADHQTVGSNELAPLLQLRLVELTADRVEAWLRDEVARRPTRAALAFRLLRAFLHWCADTPAYRGLAAEGACITRLAKDVLPKAGKKTDCLQREQLPAWFAAVRSIQNPVIAAYLQILLLIGSRREELMGLKWEDVDFRWQSMTIRDKVEGERIIPLTPYVAALLAQLPRRNQWVFSSSDAESGRLQEPTKQHRRACAVAGIEGLTLHGLRRSFASLTEWIECPTGVVAQIQGHKPSATAEKHYKVRSLDLLRMWHVRIEAWILEQAGIPLPEGSAEGLRLVAGNSKKAIL